MDLENAIGAHAQWKTKLRSAISKCESADVATISADNCCELGRWLHGAGRLAFGGSATFNVCVAKHAAFHREAGRVAQAINAKQYDAAESMLGYGTEYSEASTAIGAALIRLKRETVAA